MGNSRANVLYFTVGTMSLEDVLVPRQVDAQDIAMDRLDRNPDPRLEMPNLHIRLVYEERLDPLRVE